MRASTKYDEINLVELVVLPMANLKATLETILNRQHDITTEELLQGLHLVHQNASSILQLLPPTPAEHSFAHPPRKIPETLKALSKEKDAPKLHPAPAG